MTREEAIKTLRELWRETNDHWYEETYSMAIEALERMPFADVVEVVRCKDCKWFNKIGCAIKIVDKSDKPHEDDFCSFGEIKDGEQNDDVGHIEYSLIRRRLG